MESSITTTADYEFRLYKCYGQWWATDKLVSSLAGVPVLDLHRIIGDEVKRVEGRNLISETDLRDLRVIIPRKYQQDYGQLLNAVHSRNAGHSPEVDLLKNNPVRIESGMCCMTDLYSAYLASPEAATSNRNCKPSYFLRLKKSREMIERLVRSKETTVEELLKTSNSGGLPAKWAIREIAQSYATWLSKPLGLALSDTYARYEQRGAL